MAAVGFEPTPPKGLVPKTSALDRSATLPAIFRIILEPGAINFGTSLILRDKQTLNYV
jgi:hypothetical protein